MANEMLEKLEKNIPHIIAIAILLFILLFVVTKFKWVQCGDVPGWCPVYCSINGRSTVAFVHGDEGIGNPDLLKTMIQAETLHVAQDVPLSQLSFGYLQGFELLIVEKAKRLDDKQIKAFENYLNSGGSVIWIGDSGTANENGNLTGFRRLNTYLLVDYLNETVNDTNANLTLAIANHKLVDGLNTKLLLFGVDFAKVKSNVAVATKVALLEWHGQMLPGIIENKFVGRIVYFAIPPEQIKSKALINNMIKFMATC